MKETELAEHVIKFLEADDWDVYQEVQIDSYGRSADIVAVKKPIVWIIECKMSLSLAVLEQAYLWRQNSNLVSVAVPFSRNSRGRWFAKKVMKNYGIGMIEVDKHCARQELPPQLMRESATKSIIEALKPAHKTFAKAGSQRGRLTPFKMTCIELFEVVSKQPGILLKEAISRLGSHHYGTNQSAIVGIGKQLRLGHIKNIRPEIINGKTCLFPKAGETR